MKIVDILDIPIHALTENELLDIIKNSIKNNKNTSIRVNPITVFKPYVEYFNFKRYPQAKELLLKGDIVIADSIALVWASYCLENRVGYIRSWFKAIMLPISPIKNAAIAHRFNGIDITIKILKLAQKEKYKVVVVGGPQRNTDPINLKVQEDFLKNKFKDIDIKLYDGYDHFTSPEKIDNLFTKIKNSQVDILMLAMGFPRQEQYALLAQKMKAADIIITEGGSFDYKNLGGSVKRAPKCIQRLRLEWLFRLLLDPKRIFRQLFIIKFIHTVAKNSSK
jgi:N-acetylglucosaminyldiphosphoundecaprenol N-acetyl-beta-D-mannosaminyltransferase